MRQQSLNCFIYSSVFCNRNIFLICTTYVGVPETAMLLLLLLTKVTNRGRSKATASTHTSVCRVLYVTAVVAVLVVYLPVSLSFSSLRRFIAAGCVRATRSQLGYWRQEAMYPKRNAKSYATRVYSHVQDSNEMRYKKGQLIVRSLYNQGKGLWRPGRHRDEYFQDPYVGKLLRTSKYNGDTHYRGILFGSSKGIVYNNRFSLCYSFSGFWRLAGSQLHTNIPKKHSIIIIILIDVKTANLT